MEENNQIKKEKVLEKVQGGVNLNGVAASELVGNLANERVGITVPFHNDGKNSTGGNIHIWQKK